MDILNLNSKIGLVIDELGRRGMLGGAITTKELLSKIE
jgi:hypothetical protein